MPCLTASFSHQKTGLQNLDIPSLSKATKSHPRPEQSLPHRISRGFMSDTGTLSLNASKRAKTSSLCLSSFALKVLPFNLRTLFFLAFFLNLLSIFVLLSGGLVFGLAMHQKLVRSNRERDEKKLARSNREREGQRASHLLMAKSCVALPLKSMRFLHPAYALSVSALKVGLNSLGCTAPHPQDKSAAAEIYVRGPSVFYTLLTRLRAGLGMRKQGVKNA